MAREGQQRVEVRPGVFLWLDEADRERFAASRTEQPVAAPIETATEPEAETAVVKAPRAGGARTRRSR